METTGELVVVYVGTPWDAGEVTGLLESAGIPCFLRDEQMGTIEAPLLAAGGLGPVKVVVAAEDRERAEQVVRDFGGQGGLVEEGPAPTIEAAVEPWQCLRCGEQVEGQFDVCWNCGASKG